MYRIQDEIGPDAVFYIVHTTYAIFDSATMVNNAIIKFIFIGIHITS